MKIHSTIVILLFLTSLSPFLSSCNNSITGPTEPQPGARNYVWESFELVDYSSVNNSFYYIGGYSPNNVWISGFGEFNKSLLHYDSTGIKLYDIRSSDLFPTIPLAPYGILDEKITWFGGITSEIYKESNGTIQLYQNLDHPIHCNPSIRSFNGNNINELYGAGIIYDTNGYCKGGLWKLIDSKWSAIDTLQIYDRFFDEIKIDKKHRFFLGGSSFADSVFIYQYDLHTFKEIYIDYIGAKSMPEMLDLEGDIYFYINKKLLYYDKQFFTIKDFSQYSFLLPYKAFGRSINDLFLPSQDGIYHYNGTDVEKIYSFKKAGTTWEALLFKNDIFFLVLNIGTKNTTLIHGTLK